MTKRMLIDATHAEETRVVVLDGNRLEDFDVETSTKRQLKGNIYLAKVVRVEPSLQAAFVEYGGNRHGFLAFSEIHPDYYQIPVADRQRLLEMQAEEARLEEEEDDLELALAQATEESGERRPRSADGESRNSRGDDRGGNRQGGDRRPRHDHAAGRDDAGHQDETSHRDAVQDETDFADAEYRGADGWRAEHWDGEHGAAKTLREAAGPGRQADPRQAGREQPGAEQQGAEPWASPATPRLLAAPPTLTPVRGAPEEAAPEAWAVTGTPKLHATSAKAAQPLVIDAGERISAPEASLDDDTDDNEPYDLNGESIEVLPPPETIGGQDSDSGDDHRERRIPPRFLRHYKIQEVIRRRQIMLVQVVKEERGTKGAALTTYLSLAGRFGVLMPNSPRGGGISRKITSAADRRRLREVIAELDMPRGMGLIIRTAGANRPKPEIKRDCEYLLRLWDDIREHTLKSVAPALIYEEASLIKRAIRDVYSRDIDEILVDGEEGWRAAHDFMRMLMPAHAKKVQLWRDGGQPLFARQQVEAQLDAMLMPIVQLRSGGYLVINQAEALVAIDVNSGRSTRERNIEETALRTNLEASDEVARQLRLRDLAGLIVIDYIDMESKRHNAMVERRLKEALKNDRARIQVGHISHFGLLEMSRQRLRPSLAETSFIVCPHCGGTGHVRSIESSAIHVLRGIEDEGAKRRSAEIIVHVSTPVALYLLNHKRERLREIELRYTMRVMIAADDSQIAPQFRIDKVRTRSPDEMLPVVTQDRPLPAPLPIDAEVEEEDDIDASAAEEDEDETEDDGAEEARAGGSSAEEDPERPRKRRRRRRRGTRREDLNGHDGGDADAEPAAALAPESAGQPQATTGFTPANGAGPADEAEHNIDVDEVASREETAREATPFDAVGPEAAAGETAANAAPGEEAAEGPEEEGRGRRRGRRGGRRRRRDNEGDVSPFSVPGAEQPDLLPAYAGPTPADPFGQVFDIFDVMDRVERQAEAQPRRPAIVNTPAPEPGSPAPRSADLLAEAQVGGEPARAEPEASHAATNVTMDEPAAVPMAGQVAAEGEPKSDAIRQDVAAEPAMPLHVVEAPAGSNADGITAGGAETAPEAAEASRAAPADEKTAVPIAAQSAATSAEATAASTEPAAAPAQATATPTESAAAPAEAPPPPMPSKEAAASVPAELAAPVPADATASEPEPEAANPEPPPAEPAVRPILIGVGAEPPAERKRGWWRR